MEVAELIVYICISVINMKKNRVTIKDIAELAQVSQTTVSFYLNGKFEKMSEETKQNVEKVIKETEYTPNMIARSLATKDTKLIGVIVADISSPFSSAIVAGVDSVARKENYQIIIANGGYDVNYEKDIMNNMLNMGVGGFIVQSSIQFIPLTKKIREKGGEIVLLDSVSEDYHGEWVKTNNIEITKKALESLVEKGYENFIMIAENPNFLVSRAERKLSFEGTLSSLKVEHYVEIVEHDFDIEQFKQIAERRIKPNKKNLLFAINGRMLKKVYDYSKVLNFDIPDSVGIIGFDKWEWTDYATPTVTTISQPNYEEGKKAANLLINKLKGDNQADSSNDRVSYVFNGVINWNESTNLK